jgi:hypothetical protein
MATTRKERRERRAELAANAEAANAKNAEMTQQMRDQRALQRPPDVRGNDRILFPRARHELDQLLPNIAMDVRGFGDMTAGERGASVAKGMGRFLQPLMGAAGDMAAGVGNVVGPVVRGAGGFLNPAAAAITGNPGLGNQPDNGREASADAQGSQDTRVNPGDQSFIPGVLPNSPVPDGGLTVFGDPRRQSALPRPRTLSDSGGNTFTREGGGSREPFNPQEDAIPENYVEIIRGTDRTYQGLDDRGSTFGNREFRALPGMSLDEAARSAAAEAPGFQFLREADIDEKRADASLLNAEANQLNSIFGNIQTATDAQGAPMLMLPREDGSGYDRVEDVFPVITGMGDDMDRYELTEVTVDGLPQSVVVDLTGEEPDRNVSDEQAMTFAVRRANAIAQREFGGDLSQMTTDDWFDIFDDMAVGENVKDALYNSVSQ